MSQVWDEFKAGREEIIKATSNYAIHMYILVMLGTPFVVLTGITEAEHLHHDHFGTESAQNFALLTISFRVF